MQKYFKMSGWLLFYIAVHLIATFLIFNVSFTLLDNNAYLHNIASENIMAFVMLSMIATVLVYYLVFKAKKRDYIKFCSFKKLENRNIIWIVVMGLSMTLFTITFTGLSYISKNIPTLEEYLSGVDGGGNPFIVLLIVMLLAVFFEEIVFRGTVFREIWSNMTLSKAAFVSALIYGVFNLIFNPGWLIAVYAFVSALLFQYAFALNRSLWGSILLQEVNIVSLLILRKMSVHTSLTAHGDGLLSVLSAVGIIGILVPLYFLAKSYSSAPVSESNKQKLIV